MPAPWRALERLVDDIVDEQWGEPVELHPFTLPDVEGESKPDPTRSIVITTGILVMPGAAATGEAGAQSTGLASTPAQMDTWLSISTHNLRGAALHTWIEGDRVYFPDRDEWYTIDHPMPSVTARPQIYLARIQKGG
jgi:hypothetical protein